MHKMKVSAFILIVLLLMTMASTVLAAEPAVWVGNVKLADGDYLANGATATTKAKPTSDGYAYLEVTNGWDLHLTLHGFSYTGNGREYDAVNHRWAVIRPDMGITGGYDAEFTIHLEGKNSINVNAQQGNPSALCAAIVGDLDFIDGTAKDSLTIVSDEAGIIADRQIRISGGNVDITAGEKGADVTKGALRIVESGNLGKIVLRSINEENDSKYCAVDANKGIIIDGDCNITASVNHDGSSAVEYNSANIANYDYICIESANKYVTIRVIKKLAGIKPEDLPDGTVFEFSFIDLSDNSLNGEELGRVGFSKSDLMASSNGSTKEVPIRVLGGKGLVRVGVTEIGTERVSGYHVNVNMECSGAAEPGDKPEDRGDGSISVGSFEIDVKDDVILDGDVNLPFQPIARGSGMGAVPEIIITNTLTPIEVNLPKTGDESNLALWACAMLLSSAACMMLLRKKREA